MLFLLTLLLVACLLQFSAWGTLRGLCRYFRIEFAQAAVALEMTRWIEPVIVRFRFLGRILGVWLCPDWEEHCPPIVVLDSSLQGAPQDKPARLKIDMLRLRRFDWVLLNKFVN